MKEKRLKILLGELVSAQCLEEGGTTKEKNIEKCDEGCV